MEVNTNPLQGFPSYPVIQYDGNYRHEQPIFIHPSDFNTYPHMHLIQNHVTPNQNVPISYNDVQRIYLENILQNRINPAFNANCGQTGPYINPAEKLGPNVVNNYIIVPVESNAINETKDCNKRTVKSKLQKDRKLPTSIENDNSSKKKKCKKRKNTANNSINNVEKCSIGKRNKLFENDNTANKQPDENNVKACKKKKSRNKLRNTATVTDKEDSDNEKQIKDKNSKSIPESIQNVNRKICKPSKYDDDEKYIVETVKVDPSNNCRNVRKKDKFCDCSQIQELDDYFNIEEDCGQFNYRCTRNNREDNVQKYQQPYYLPSDFTNNMAPYMSFDQHLFDTSGYFPYNFDYLYKMQQPPKGNSNPPQKKSNSTRRIGRRKKQKKGSKNNNRNKQNSKQNFNNAKIVEGSTQNLSCEKIVELSPEVPKNQPDSEIVTGKIAPVKEKQIEETCQDIPAAKTEEIDIPLSSQDNTKEIESNGYYEINQDDYSPIYDDYYPQFHSDNIYTSKEVLDWDNFHDRHYYTSSNNNELDRKRGKFESLDEATIPSQVNNIKTNDVKPYMYPKIDNENNKKQEFDIKANNIKENDNVKLQSEEIQFRTPPALDFPDFKTEMINKDQLIPKIEEYYQPNNKEVYKYKRNKMSTYSDTKTAESNENINKIVALNEVETVYRHSKVAKYGIPSNKDQDKINISDDNNDDNDTSDEKPIIVIAKSLPYPID